MAETVLTDSEIALLISTPKRVQNPGARSRTVGKHNRRDFIVRGDDGKHEFALFLRQSLAVQDDFSAGLRWISKSGEDVTLARFNGPSHIHVNALEGDRLEFACHIHQATERYVAAGKKEEGYALISTEYKTLNGALDALVKRCNIGGIDTTPDPTDLFANL